MIYTRKRALLACDFCRHRKRKCNGERPCSTCRESNVDCSYKELPSDRVEDTSPAAVVERLVKIEAMLERQIDQLEYMGSSSRSTTVDSFSHLEQQQQQQRQFSAPPVLDHYSPPIPQLDGQEHHELDFTVPQCHSATTMSLLSFPLLQEQVGYYPQDFFLDVEEQLDFPELMDPSPASPSGLPDLDLGPTEMADLKANYFRHVHPHQPLFTEDEFDARQATMSPSSTGDSSSGSPWRERGRGSQELVSAIRMCVYALGALFSSSQPPPGEIPGFRLFKPAFDTMTRYVALGFRSDGALCQALLLASSYFAHLGRPLHSWRMASLASRELVASFQSPMHSPSTSSVDDSRVRVFWQCFLIECDRIGELDVTRSGIEPYADHMALPQSRGVDEDENTITLIAEHCAIRRLLNRITHALYGPSSSPPPPPPSSLPQTVSSSIDTNARCSSPPIGADIVTNSTTDNRCGFSYSSPPPPSHGHSNPYSTPPPRHAVTATHHSTTTTPHNTRALSVESQHAHHHWNTLSLHGLLNVSSELDRQLEEWYASIPGPLRPHRGTAPLPSERLSVLRLRYYDARQLIHRPFVLRAAALCSQQQHGQPVDPAAAQMLVDRSRACIDACVAYLRNATAPLAEEGGDDNKNLLLLGPRSPYLWSLAQSGLACLALLWVARYGAAPLLAPAGVLPGDDVLASLHAAFSRRLEMSAATTATTAGKKAAKSTAAAAAARSVSPSGGPVGGSEAVPRRHQLSSFDAALHIARQLDFPPQSTSYSPSCSPYFTAHGHDDDSMVF